jgi:hypothetical protein
VGPPFALVPVLRRQRGEKAGRKREREREREGKNRDITELPSVEGKEKKKGTPG